MIAPSWFFGTGSGLLVQGCPYKDVYDYYTANHWQSYNANPNWGRRKRQIRPEDRVRIQDEGNVFEVDRGQCKEIAANAEKQFPQFKGLTADAVQRMCEIDGQFLPDAAKQIGRKLEIIQDADDIRQKNFPDGFEPEALKDENVFQYIRRN